MSKTHPDLNDGYLQLAHELVAAVACAGFGKWEMIVLREVFDQIYGPKKLRTAHVPPSELAQRLGTVKQSIVRAVGGLVSSGVLVHTDKCEYRFVKNYGAWTFNGSPRFSAKEIGYCREARRKNKSEPSAASTPQDENVSIQSGNKNVADGETNPFPGETNLLPTGNKNVTGGQQICCRGETDLFPETLPPLEPPIGEPARFEKGEKEEKGGENAPATVTLGPEFTRIGNLAIELSGDFSWGPWVCRMGQIGYPGRWIEDVVQKMAGRGEMSMSLGHAILKRYQKQHGTDDDVRPRTSTRLAAPVRVDNSNRYVKAPSNYTNPNRRQ